MPDPADSADVRDLIVEAVNARDLELLDVAEGIDLMAHVGDEVGYLMERRPRVMLTRGDVDDSPVAAMWAPDEHDRYELVGHLDVVVEEEAVRLLPVEGQHPNLVSEAPAGFEVAEWEASDQDGWPA